MAAKRYKTTLKKSIVNEGAAGYGSTGIEFSKHALEQMEIRGITRQEVVSVLNDPQLVKKENGKTIMQSVVENSNYLIRIFVNNTVIPNIIITVYKTSKIKKYHEGKI